MRRIKIGLTDSKWLVTLELLIKNVFLEKVILEPISEWQEGTSYMKLIDNSAPGSGVN